jgi:hypothetical protein
MLCTRYGFRSGSLHLHLGLTHRACLVNFQIVYSLFLVPLNLSSTKTIVNPVIISNSFVKGVNHLVAQENASLIIMGTKGATGLNLYSWVAIRRR